MIFFSGLFKFVLLLFYQHFLSSELTPEEQILSAFIISIGFGNDNDKILVCDDGSETDFVYYEADWLTFLDWYWLRETSDGREIFAANTTRWLNNLFFPFSTLRFRFVAAQIFTWTHFWSRTSGTLYNINYDIKI